MQLIRKRSFFKNAGLAGVGTFASALGSENPNAAQQAKLFNLDYAIQEGMFSTHAVRELIDQLKFTKEQGFFTYEDNDMRLRSPQRREEIGNMLSKLQMRMGVFVGHTLDCKSLHKPIAA